jgi:hypothetical protein
MKHKSEGWGLGTEGISEGGWGGGGLGGKGEHTLTFAALWRGSFNNAVNTNKKKGVK